jgi:hypothetical protein
MPPDMIQHTVATHDRKAHNREGSTSRVCTMVYAAVRRATSSMRKTSELGWLRLGASLLMVHRDRRGAGPCLYSRV